MSESEIEIEIDLAPVRYRIRLDRPKDFEKDAKRLRSFIHANDEKLQQIASEVLGEKRKRVAKSKLHQSIDCKLPNWFYKVVPSVPESMALFLYFAETPLTMNQLTDLVNAELKGKKRDLRNVSRHITSKGWTLYGLTSYDNVTQTYTLNKYGTRWVDNELIPLLTRKAHHKSTTNKDDDS